MDSSTQGTGGIILARIEAALNQLRGRTRLPYGADSGALSVPSGAARVDLGNLFVMTEWAPPSSGPADFPLVFRYQSDSGVISELGRGWALPYQRFVETAES